MDRGVPDTWRRNAFSWLVEKLPSLHAFKTPCTNCLIYESEFVSKLNFIHLPLATISLEAGGATLPELNTWNEFHPTPVQRFVSK